MPQDLVTSISQDRVPEHDQASVSEVITALHIPGESNNLSLVSKTTKDLSGDDATTIKRKQSDMSQDEVVSKRKRRGSQNNVQNHQRSPSSQHTRPLNKELNHMLSPAGNVQRPIAFAAEVYDEVKPGSGVTMSNEAPSGSGNPHLMEKDSTPDESPELPTNFNL
jgi:hypothetical protein